MSENAVISPPAALVRKLEQMSQRHAELQNSLNDPTFVSNPQLMIAAIKESGQLGPVVEKYREFREAARQVGELTEMSGGGDAEMAALAADELPGATDKARALVEALKDQLIAAEDDAIDSFFLEIRAG